MTAPTWQPRCRVPGHWSQPANGCTLCQPWYRRVPWWAWVAASPILLLAAWVVACLLIVLWPVAVGAGFAFALARPKFGAAASRRKEHERRTRFGAARPHRQPARRR